METQRVERLMNWMKNFGNRPDWAYIPTSPYNIVKIKNDIILLSEDIRMDSPHYSKELFRLKDSLFFMNGTINQPVFGQVFAIINALKNEANMPEKNVWGYIHPLIANSSNSLFQSGHYANAAEDAFIEINDRLKRIYRRLNPTAVTIPDGDAAITTLFSPKNPMIKVCDISTESGLNEQKGLMFMLQGALAALRNPKAHANISISKEDAMRRLIFASLLMYKIDEALIYSRITE